MTTPHSEPPPQIDSDDPFRSWEFLYSKLPPETNTGNLHFGVGSMPLQSASQRWNSLAKELKSTSESLTNWCTARGQDWSSPAARRMVDAVAEFQEWLDRFTDQIDQTATQNSTFMWAYVEASQGSVPPFRMMANRKYREELVASNEFEKNHAEIAELDREYEKFWAKDVDVMRTYEQRTHDALKALPSWEEPPHEDAQLTLDSWPDRQQRTSFTFEE